MERITQTEIEEMCSLIIRLYVCGREWPPALAARVQSWLADGRHDRAKDMALREVFDEIMARHPDICDRVFHSALDAAFGPAPATADEKADA